jgi:hypothetical protein
MPVMQHFSVLFKLKCFSYVGPDVFPNRRDGAELLCNCNVKIIVMMVIKTMIIWLRLTVRKVSTSYGSVFLPLMTAAVA